MSTPMAPMTSSPVLKGRATPGACRHLRVEKRQALKTNRRGAQARNEIVRARNRLGRTIWENGSGCRQRSSIEAKMRCFGLLNEHIHALNFDRQVPELQVRAAVLSHFTCLSTPITVTTPQVRIYKGKIRPLSVCATKPFQRMTRLKEEAYLRFTARRYSPGLMHRFIFRGATQAAPATR